MPSNLCYIWRMNIDRLPKIIWLVLAGLLLLTGLAACGEGTFDLPLPSGAGSTPSPAQTAPASNPLLPSPTPEQPTVLSLEDVWVGVEGPATQILSISPGGETRLVNLPLNEGQQASDVTLSQDSLTLAYLVWQADDTQRGIAVWNLREANARLLAQPLPGYRVTDLLLADDASRLAYVLVEEGVPLDSADWRLESVASMDVPPVLMTSRQELADMLPPDLIGWPEDGGLLANFSDVEGGAQGIYAIPDGAQPPERVVPVEDQALLDPLIVGVALSPDRTRLAYLTYDDRVDGLPEAQSITNVVRIVDRVSGGTRTMVPPANHAIFGMRWHPDNRQLLLDIVEFDEEDETQMSQHWALVDIGQPLPWDLASFSAENDYLFDYQSYGSGVVFTILPDDDAWQLYIIDDLLTSAAPRPFSLSDLVQESGAPVILHIPVP